MRKAALAGVVFVACGFATSAQFSVTPRVGIEQAFTCVQYNNTKGIKPMCSNISPQVGLRMDYLINKTHGPFVGVATNRSVVTYEFTNPETGASEFTSSQGDWKLRLEAGYQVSSKPINLGRTAKPATGKAPGAFTTPCAARKMMLEQANANPVKKPVMNVRIQPYAGMAVVPNPVTAISSTVKSNETVYQYSAGNWNSAIITGVNLAFAKGNVSKYVVGLQYLMGIGNLGRETLVTPQDTKQLTTQLKSNASAWNITVGMPLNFMKNKEAAPPKAVELPKKVEAQKAVETPAPPAPAPVQEKKHSCGYYRSRCGY
ncbi:hypothetical protein A3860_32235 [Niastella vici]|uniref:Outer membrane protein beta-barrel domain-containing protein n=1 Tax=Niastella vici TaxID=1703345 RepID=A0A1V9FQW4_9BACT|nr:hypothetical protein [Niastella vici]OQP60671.1 hypothetical protein A3860_32235 [Niastella vici]